MRRTRTNQPMPKHAASANVVAAMRNGCHDSPSTDAQPDRGRPRRRTVDAAAHTTAPRATASTIAKANARYGGPTSGVSSRSASASDRDRRRRSDPEIAATRAVRGARDGQRDLPEAGGPSDVRPHRDADRRGHLHEQADDDGREQHEGRRRPADRRRARSTAARAYRPIGESAPRRRGHSSIVVPHRPPGIGPAKAHALLPRVYWAAPRTRHQNSDTGFTMSA